MQDRIKIEVLDLTEDSDGEQNIKKEPLTPVKEIGYGTNFESGESSGFQKSPKGKLIRNIDKCIDKAIAEIRKGQSLMTVAFQYGISQEDLYNKLVSRNLPRETDILTSAEENSLFKWIVRSNQNNILVFKHQLMEKVGKLKKIMNITPIFAKSKFGRMWFEYFMKKHPEIYENDGLLMMSKMCLQSQPDGKLEPEIDEILSREEEDTLVNWILTSNTKNSLIFKFDLMRRVGKLNNVSKLFPGFSKSKFGRIWYERFLKRHPEIYENDELILPTENLLGGEKLKNVPIEDENSFVQIKSCTKYAIKDAVVILHDFRKDENSPYKLNEKDRYELQTTVNKIEDFDFDLNHIKNDSTLEDSGMSYDERIKDIQDESGIHSDQCSSKTLGSPIGFLDDDFQENGREWFANKLKKPSERPRCSLCTKTFCNKSKLKRHISTIHLPNKLKKPSERPRCSLCSKTFCNKSKLKRHISTIHLPKEQHKMTCLQCQKKFSSRYHLIVHMTHVHSSEFHQCKECGRQFKFKTSLRKHFRTVHESLEFETNIFFCDICEKGFKYKNSLEAHIIYGHLKEKKKFSCDVCEKTFVKLSLMLRHKTRHSKIKPMECIHCGKTFSRKYILREHITNCTKNNKREKFCDEFSPEEDAD